jgi:hypothetical protein
MPISFRNLCITAFCVITAILLLRSTSSCNKLLSHVRMATMPRVMLWAWERQEQLSCLDTTKLGIAFYAGTIILTNNDFFFQPRLQSLKIPPSTYLEAVVRIENRGGNIPQLSNSTMRSLLSTITTIANRPNIKAIQIDYDAKVNERAFYRHLLADLRQALPNHIPLTITALASWCLGDNWLTSIPVDEVVPMLFDMGAGRQDILSFIKLAKWEQMSLLQECIGLCPTETDTTDIFKQRFTKWPKRIYFFSKQPWNTNTIRKAQAQTWF